MTNPNSQVMPSSHDLIFNVVKCKLYYISAGGVTVISVVQKQLKIDFESLVLIQSGVII